MLISLMSACQTPAPTAIIDEARFPTMTPGQAIVGILDSPANQAGQGEFNNPATAVAETNALTPTPNYNACPFATGEVSLDKRPEDNNGAQAIARFFTFGGTVEALKEQLAEDWDAFDEDSFVRDNVDLTGEGKSEIIIAYNAPGDVGTLLILGCESGEYKIWLEAIADGTKAPQLIWTDDLNADGIIDLVYNRRVCLEADYCATQTHIINWDAASGRFVNLIDANLISETLPNLADMDNDQVTEIILQLDHNGTSKSGPLRTGVHVYDWNGSIYTLSIVQLDPPRYWIQWVQQADKLLIRGDYPNAIALYESSLNKEDLGNWFNNDPQILGVYSLFRLMQAYLATGNENAAAEIFVKLNEQVPLDENTTIDSLAIYPRLTYTFWNVYQLEGRLNKACDAVLKIIDKEPEALNLLNRYGESSPQYKAQDLCPF